MAQIEDLREELERETATCGLLRDRLERSESRRQKAEAQVAVYSKYVSRRHERTVRLHEELLNTLATPEPQPELLTTKSAGAGDFGGGFRPFRFASSLSTGFDRFPSFGQSAFGQSALGQPGSMPVLLILENNIGYF